MFCTELAGVYVSDLYSSWDFIVHANVREPSFGVYCLLCHRACDVDVCQYYSVCAAGHRMQLADKGHAACLAALHISVRAPSRILQMGPGDSWHQHDAGDSYYCLQHVHDWRMQQQRFSVLLSSTSHYPV